MKRAALLFIFTILFNLSGIYNVGDTVSDISFTEYTFDSTGSITSTSRTLYSLIDDNKPVIIYFFEISEG